MAYNIEFKIGSDLITGSLKAYTYFQVDDGECTDGQKLILQYDKYFPYDNGNGEPIYNEDTGEELRDPITGL